MTKEQSFFIRILSDHLNGRETKCIEDMDWDVIHQYARKHQVSGMVYSQVKNHMPADIQNAFRQETIATIYHAANRDNDFAAVKKELNENNIPYFVIKGLEVAALYPNPKLRSMGDIDLVVKPEDREKSQNIIINNGYECISRQDEREWQYYKNKMELELHDRLVYEEAVNEKGQDEFFNDCWRYVQDGQLDWNFHLLFLIFHLRKHFMNSGVGFRMFMDLAVVAQKIEINWTWMQKHLVDTRMITFAQTCYGFIDKWFDIHTPIEKSIEEDFYEKATQKIFADGIYGFDNIENTNSDIINIIRKGKNIRVSKKKYIIRKVFPTLTDMKNDRTYKYIHKCKLLLPIAWLQRIAKIIKNRGIYSAKSDMEKIYALDDIIQKRDNMLKKWGL